MTLYGDYATISATTSGVDGSISVPVGARLVGLNINMKTADAGIISAIEIKGTGLQRPVKIVPNIFFGSIATNMYGISVAPTPAIDLTPYQMIAKTGTILINVTVTSSQTVTIGLMWTL
jgi:hypothetical protein